MSDDVDSVSSDRTRVEAPLPKATEEKDVEASAIKLKNEDGAASDAADEKGVLVDWVENDPECPKNWGKRQKWIATIIASMFTMLAPLTSTICAPAEDQIAEQYGITSPVLRQMLTTIMVLAFSFGPVLFGPLSELYGRRVILQACNIFYMIFNLSLAWSPNATAFYVFRFLAGIGGSGPLSIGGGVVGDVFRAEERGVAVAVYSVFPLLGPGLAPILGGWIAERTTWQWCFWSTTAFSALVNLGAAFFLHESYEPTLLERRARKLRKEQPGVRFYTRHTSAHQGLSRVVSNGLLWPLRLCIHEPILQWICIVQSLFYGLLYLALTEIPAVYQDYYGESLGIASLHYIATLVGFFGAAQLQGQVVDPLYRHLKKKHGVGRPEFRIPPLYVGAAMLPIGFLLFGWAAEKRVFWLVPDIGLVLISGGMISANQATQTYVIDAYPVRAASALAVIYFLRALFGFGLPLAAPKLFNSLTLGGGCSLLAGLSILLALPAAPLLWRYGQRLRRSSRYASKDDLDMETEK